MMPNQTLHYNTLDVFTTTAFAGNQLALVHIPTTMTVSEAQKQQFAIELNYSETAMLHHPPLDAPAAEYRAQISTPKSELPFAGHPTISTALWIFEHLENDRDNITIHLGAGPVYVHYDRTKRVATAAVPHNIRIYQNSVPWSRVIANQPGLAAASPASALSHSQKPVVSPVKGMNFALVDLTPQPDLLKFLKVTKDDIPSATDLDQDFSDDTLTGNLFYYICPDQETPDGVTRIRQRMMAIELEDPAKGVASTTLTAYPALSRGDPGQRYKFEIVQGVEMGRASTMFVDVTLDQYGKIVKDIELSGQGVQVMSGEINF